MAQNSQKRGEIALKTAHFDALYRLKIFAEKLCDEDNYKDFI
jgi:hypothetical protein